MTADSKKAEKEPVPELSDEQVRDYLKDHVDFFERHPDMLDHLHISHSSGSAVSLVEKQVSVLRERNMDMRKRLNSLTANARDNDKLYELTRKLILGLLDATSLEQLAQTFSTGMREDFDVEYASLIVFGDPRQSSEGCRVESAEKARIEIGALLKSKTPLCGPLRGEELGYLFPRAGQVGSAAVMPLSNGSELGLIAVGSSDANHYTSNMGTLFLGHIGDVLSRLLPRLQNGTAAEQP
ncbi:MAG: DUF484 family protein [Halieaceae bacterium]